MIARNLDLGKLHNLFTEGVPIPSIAIILDVAESEIHYAIAHLRKKNPEDWPKRGKGFVGKPAKEEPPTEPLKEKVEIKASFPPILPPVEKVNNEVVTRKMTPEELERLNSMGKQTTTSTGAKIPKVNNYFAKSSVKPIEEVVEMKKPEGLTKEIYLKLKAEGNGNAKIERDYGMRPNSIYILLKTWEITPASKTPSPEGPKGLIALNASKGIIIKPGVSGADVIVSDQLLFETALEQSEIISEQSDEQADVIEEAPVKEMVVDPKSNDSAMQEIKPESSTSGETSRKYLLLRIPLIDVGANRIEQRLKLLEEMNEFATEVELRDMDYPKALSEMFDAIQTIAGLARAQLQDLIIEEDLDEKIDRLFQHHNKLHVEKIGRYAAERGWKVSGL